MRNTSPEWWQGKESSRRPFLACGFPSPAGFTEQQKAGQEASQNFCSLGFYIVFFSSK